MVSAVTLLEATATVRPADAIERLDVGMAQAALEKRSECTGALAAAALQGLARASPANRKLKSPTLLE